MSVVCWHLVSASAKKAPAMRGFLALKKWSGTKDLQHKKRLTHRHRLKIFTANNHYERSKVPVVPGMSMTSLMLLTIEQRGYAISQHYRARICCCPKCCCHRLSCTSK
jgi:hypothetical protein